MTRLIDRLHLLSQLGLIVIVASSCMYAAPAFAFYGASEQPTPDEPVIEEDDDFVIPDDPDQDVDDVGTPEEDEEEQQPVAPTKPTPPVAPQGGSGDASQMEISLARALIEKAEAFASAGKWRDAAATYIEANEYLPNDPTILQGLQHAYAMLDQGQLLDTYQKQLNMDREAARAMFDARISSANDRLLREDYDNARRDVERAIVRLERDDRKLFSEEEFLQRLGTAKTLLAQVAQQQEQWQQQLLLNQATERARDQAERQSVESKKRERAEALKKVKELSKEFSFTAGMLKGALAE